MAYTEIESNPIPEGAAYYSGKMPLGDYNFYLQYDAATATVTTRCDMPDGIRGATSRQLPTGTQIQQWRVEANETEASVYAILSGEIVPCSPTADLNRTLGGNTYTFSSGSGKITISASSVGSATQSVLMASGESGAVVDMYNKEGKTHEYYHLVNQITLLGKTAFYATQTSSDSKYPVVSAAPIYDGPLSPQTAWNMIYGTEGQFSALVARFAINIRDAGGYPGGSGDWISPGDWNSDPTTTLHLTVEGALSGRHNDPLEDPSYSYAPADNTATAGYGCGGDGGHGGGGGGGASTVIVRQFATNKANYKDIQALAKRHGYGSGGGKGGNGGDGCILIYY